MKPRLCMLLNQGVTQCFVFKGQVVVSQLIRWHKQNYPGPEPYELKEAHNLFFNHCFMCSQMLYLCVLEPLLHAYKVKKIEDAPSELELQTAVNHHVYAESEVLLIWQSSKCSEYRNISLEASHYLQYNILYYLVKTAPQALVDISTSFSSYFPNIFPPPNHGRQSVIQRCIQHDKVSIAYSIPKPTYTRLNSSNGICNHLFDITNSKDVFHFKNDYKYSMLQQDFSKKTVMSKKEDFLCLHVSFQDQ